MGHDEASFGCLGALAAFVVAENEVGGCLPHPCRCHAFLGPWAPITDPLLNFSSVQCGRLSPWGLVGHDEASFGCLGALAAFVVAENEVGGRLPTLAVAMPFWARGPP